MVCMDLVGHRVGSDKLPNEVGLSLFALGGEKSLGAHELVHSLARAEKGAIIRSANADFIEKCPRKAGQG
jgi:hypothetical protein